MQAGARKRTSERLRASDTFPINYRNGLTSAQLLGGRFHLQFALDKNSLVWQATDECDRQVVLKTGPSDTIRREFRLLASLDHPHIVKASECFEIAEDSVLVLECLSGGDMVSLAGLEARHWLGPFVDVIDALRYLHREQIVHRDLKARNVLFGGDGRARVVDFGSARSVGSQWTAGGTTESIVDPKRGNAPVSPADDSYALICLLHELLFGALPGAAKRPAVPGWASTLAELVDSYLNAESASDRPDLEQIEAIVKSSLAKRPDFR